MTLIKDAGWNGAMKALAPDENYPSHDADGQPIPWHPLVSAMPYEGMPVDLWYVHMDKTYVEASLCNTQYPTTTGPAQKFGQGMIVAVRYVAGRSGKLYPSVDVETDRPAAVALGSIRTPHKTATSRANMERVNAHREPAACTCNHDPHRSTCPVYRRDAKRRSRANGAG